ncbi:unnamed protein product [Peronospora destructor]|uniref:Transcription factor CBF/NF-Y/archaeal histone domain-containing protein n=1 Tax=Peronospora destructor TaxID=86335 RepID=A0AAV0VA65_9STRA|nr:unnamed protein product [Peronospora destructor]
MKQRNMLKSRVKRLLKEQKDMGQVGESAVLCCASAVQIFVNDLAKKMQKQSTEGHGLTPIELKKSILASGKLDFLHEKVAAIDENAAKYHRQARGGKKRTQAATAKKPSTKKARTTRTEKEAKFLTDTSVAQVISVTKAQPLLVKEDEDYDESDGDS